MAKKTFKSVKTNLDFVENEKKLLDWWYKSGLVKKYLNKNQNSNKRFSFMDGPITANNPMGVHHAWGRSLKDLYQRYKNMKGFAQRFQNGFDCQGLWVEVEVEKEKGFKTKKDIEEYGVENFVNDCKARVLKYSKVQTEQSKRLGYFMDWDNSYYTMSEENNYMIWYFLKKLHNQNCLYKGHDSVPWCPRCGTAISHHEIATEGYKQLTHESVYMRFPVIKNGQLEKGEFLLVWTTTPWTIPADTLVAVSPEIEYALVEFEGKKYWLAKNLIEKTFKQNLTPIKVATGQDLIEKEGVSHYQAAFDDLPIIANIAKNSPNHFHALVLAKDLVNEEEGTGLVHIVPGAGTEDHQLAKNLGWQDIIFPVVDETGAYIDGYGQLTGQNAKEKPKLVINYLKEKHNGLYFFTSRSYTHSYPVCWRCGTELIWRIVDEWYISMDQKWSDGQSLREKMIKVAKNISWLPKFGLKRELDWLNNMEDWLISKKRYWGLALPIWQCQCGHFQVIGAKEELKQKAIEGWDKFNGHTPHKPWIDEVKIKCDQCGKKMSRVPDVGNPWLDAGIVNFSSLIDPKTGKISYLTDKEYFKKWFPADFITECFPGQFRNWFYSLIAMSTALENRQPTKTILGHASVRDEKGDEMHKSKGNAIWFDDAADKMSVDVMRWLYARQNPEFNLNFGYKIADEVRRQFIFLFWNSYRFFVTYAQLNNWQTDEAHQESDNKLDQWIVSRLENTKNQVEKNLDRFHHHLAIGEIEQFLNDLSLWYVRRSRNRVNPVNNNKKDLNCCLATLYYCLRQISLLLAPFIPFLTETIWQALAGNGNNWQVNDSIHLVAWPIVNKKAINQNLEKQMAFVRNIVNLGHSLRKESQIKVRQPLAKLTVHQADFKLDSDLLDLAKDELNVKEIKINLGAGQIKVELDTKITAELEAEGQAREIIRQIQIERKEQKLNLDDKIIIYLPSWPDKWENEIKQRVGAKEIRKAKEFKIKKI